jgi:hypothetical protein
MSCPKTVVKGEWSVTNLVLAIKFWARFVSVFPWTARLRSQELGAFPGEKPREIGFDSGE